MRSSCRTLISSPKKATWEGVEVEDIAEKSDVKEDVEADAGVPPTGDDVPPPALWALLAVVGAGRRF